MSEADLEGCRLIIPVLEAVCALHGHTTGSGDAIDVAADLAEWLSWRIDIDGGWKAEGAVEYTHAERISEPGLCRFFFDDAVRKLAAAAIVEFEAR